MEESGGSSVSKFSLSDHLQQLDTLYEEVKQVHDPEYIAFLRELIDEKKKSIRTYLQIHTQ